MIGITIANGTGHYRNRRCIRVCLANADEQTRNAIVGHVKEADGRWSGAVSIGWLFPATHGGALAVKQLIEHAPNAHWQHDDEFATLIIDALEADRILTADPAKLPPVPATLMAERMSQRRGYHMIRTRPANMLAWEMGVGKSKTVVDAINNLDLGPVLILCPPSVVHVWASEIAKHTALGKTWALYGVTDTGSAQRTGSGAGALQGYAYIARNGPVADRAAQLKLLRATAEAMHLRFVVVMNYQAAWRKAMQEVLLGYKWGLCVCDESHAIKAPGGVTSKFMARLRERCERRVCLTGTPMPHSPLDIYGQFRFLDPGVYGENYTTFKLRYPFDGAVTLDLVDDWITVTGDYAYTRRCREMNVKGRHWNGTCWRVPSHTDGLSTVCRAFLDVPVAVGEAFDTACVNAGVEGIKFLRRLDRATMETEFTRRLGMLMYRVTAAEVLDLPELVDEFRSVELSVVAQRVYRDLQRTLVAEVGDGTVTAANVLAKIVRLQQVTSGMVPVTKLATFEADVEMIRVDRGKMDALAEIFETLPPDEPVVVFCRFRSDLDAAAEVAAECERKACVLRGGQNDIGAVWTDEPGTVAGDATVAVIQIQAGGLGIDLTRARYAVFFSLTHSMGEFKQAIARLHRHGQTRKTIILHLVARGTVDEAIYQALAAREDVVKHILGNLNPNTGETE